jgi:hypothetical protein
MSHREFSDLVAYSFPPRRTMAGVSGGSGDNKPDETKIITKVRSIGPFATTRPLMLEQVDQLIEVIQSNMAGQYLTLNQN